MKHVRIDNSFIKDEIDSGTILISHVPSKQQEADILTKALSKPEFEALVCKLEMNDIYSTTWGGVLDSILGSYYVNILLYWGNH